MVERSAWPVGRDVRFRLERPPDDRELRDWPIGAWILLDCTDQERRQRLSSDAWPDDIAAALTDKEVRAAVDGTDKTGVPDAVAGVLDALYDLWEYWQLHAALTMKQADERVRGDPDGETAAALVHACGGEEAHS